MGSHFLNQLESPFFMIFNYHTFRRVVTAKKEACNFFGSFPPHPSPPLHCPPSPPSFYHWKTMSILESLLLKLYTHGINSICQCYNAIFNDIGVIIVFQVLKNKNRKALSKFWIWCRRIRHLNQVLTVKLQGYFLLKYHYTLNTFLKRCWYF